MICTLITSHYKSLLYVQCFLIIFMKFLFFSDLLYLNCKMARCALCQWTTAFANWRIIIPAVNTSHTCILAHTEVIVEFVCTFLGCHREQIFNNKKDKNFSCSFKDWLLLKMDLCWSLLVCFDGILTDGLFSRALEGVKSQPVWQRKWHLCEQEERKDGLGRDKVKQSSGVGRDGYLKVHYPGSITHWRLEGYCLTGNLGKVILLLLCSRSRFLHNSCLNMQLITMLH